MAGDRRLFASAAAAALAAAAPAWGQEAPSTNASAQSSDDNEIVVRAEGDQVRIDRRIYNIRNDPIAQASDMYDVLGRIPSVNVSPSGSVTLLGAGNPTIEINGQPVLQGANPEQILRGITGPDVERIEVITNPSTQYSSATSGGIINIITRQRYNSGFTGNASAMADTFGSRRANVAPNWSRGPWSFGGRISYFDYKTHNETMRVHEDLASGVTTSDLARNRNASEDAGGNLQTTYQPSRANKATLSLDLYSDHGDNSQPSDRTSASVPIFHQSQNAASDDVYDRLALLIQHDGARPREQIRLNAALTHFASGSDTIIAVTPVIDPPPSPFLAGARVRDDEANVTLDYDLPLGGRSFLTLGAAADGDSTDINDAERTLIGPPGAGDSQSSLAGDIQTYAAYSTYQFGLGDWLFQPGLRAEDYRREVASQGIETVRGDLRFFPTLHARRSWAWFDVDLSYTRRIRRPDISELDPAVRFTDATHASQGNPDLAPATTDAYEANFTHQGRNRLFSVTLYDRLNHDIFSPFVSQAGSLTLSTTVNAGESEERGFQAIMRGPFGSNWRYALTANVLDRSFDTLMSGARQREEALEYNGVASLEYRDRNPNEVGADDVQLEVRFQGPRHTLQQETDQYYYAYLNWRRRLARNFYSFVQIAGALSATYNRSLTRTDDFVERSVTDNPGVRLRLTLMYQFGAQTDRPPPEPSDNSGAAPR